MKPQITRKETLAAGHYISLERLHYLDHNQTERQWEAVQRTGNTNAAVIIATMKPDDKILLIRQFRPPLNSYVLEFPAGLIDPGENAAEAAFRELHEETGYQGTIDWMTPGAASSAGLTGELLILVFMSVDTSLPYNQHPVPDLQEGEDIEVFAIPKEGLTAFLEQQTARGDILDSRLASWAAGLQMKNHGSSCIVTTPDPDTLMKFRFQSYYLDQPLHPGRIFDVFIPEKIKENTAIFFVHGGGWQAGSRTGYHLLMEQLNRQGFLCASTDYRLVTHGIPGTTPITALDQLQDIRESYDAFCTILQDLGRPLNIAVSGSSAGAHLASLLLCASPGECGEAVQLKNPWCKPACGILQSTPATFTPWPNIFPQIWSSMQQAAGSTYQANPELFRKLSLDSYIRKDNPPLFFLEAENEHMFPARMNQKIVDAHQQMNIASQLKTYPDAEHGFLYAASRPVQIEALDDMIKFIRKHPCMIS